MEIGIAAFHKMVELVKIGSAAQYKEDTMKEIRSYWCEDKPTLEDIKEAYTEVSKGFIIIIQWHVEYSGMYSRTIREEEVNKYSAEEYFEKCIPHVYAV